MTNKISILGPNYSYCHVLALKAFPNSEFLMCQTIPEIFKNVFEGKTLQGLVPIENMIHGTVRESITSLQKYKIKINEAYDLPIHHCLASKNKDFKIISSKQEALSQCSILLEEYKNLGLQIADAPSTSKAMETASQTPDYAAIGSLEAAKSLGLQIIRENVGDNHNNVTRFILISKRKSDEKLEDARTSLMIIPKKDRPGLLYEILSVFKEENVNLTKIESIPTGKKLGDYEFFIEISGSLKEDRIIKALNKLKTMQEVYPFGSYKLRTF